MGESYDNVEAQDEIESQALYELIESQILPTFYDRDDHGVPREWVSRMKKCILHLAPEFNTNRMVQQYTTEFYLPALRRSRRLKADGLKGACELSDRKAKLRQHWGSLRIDPHALALQRFLQRKNPSR